MGAYVYAPKSKTPETAKLTPLAQEILRTAASRSRASKSNVIEHLLRTRGQDVVADDFARHDEEPAPSAAP